MILKLRNDDVCFGSTLPEIRTFCELCDRYGFQALHAITPIGAVRPIKAEWDNERIRREAGNRLFLDNTPVVEYLLGRRDKDLFAVHGLWHTHALDSEEISAGAYLIHQFGFHVSYEVPPFNDPRSRCGPVRGVKWSGGETPRLESYLNNPEDMPPTDIAYCHSHRFVHGPWNWPMLESCLSRLAETGHAGNTQLLNAARP